jgi:hypothetical protein
MGSNKSNKAFGHAVEQLFFAQAMLRGLDVFVPLGDYLQQDCLVSNAAGKNYRVQVKGTDCCPKSDSSRNRWRITAQRSGRLPLDCTKVDVMAAYVRPHDVWYFIPCLEIASRCVWLYASNDKSKAQYEKYKNGWGYFKT